MVAAKCIAYFIIKIIVTIVKYLPGIIQAYPTKPPNKISALQAEFKLAGK